MSSRHLSWIRGALTVSGFLALGIGAWRSFPAEERNVPAAPGLSVVLFDVSAGTTRLRPAHGIWARRRLREEALKAEEAGEDLGLGLYAADVRRLGLEPAKNWLDRLEGRAGETLALGTHGSSSLGSELDAGLALFEEELLRQDRVGARLTVYGQRDYSGADPHPRLALLQEAGVRIDWKPLGESALVDLGIEGIDLPLQPEPGAPLVGRFQLALAPGGRSRQELQDSLEFELVLLIQGDGDLLERRVPLQLPTDIDRREGYVRWSTRVDLGPASPGVNRVAAAAQVRRRSDGVEGDPIPENNQRSAECRAGSTLIVAAVAAPERLDDLRAWIGSDPRRWPGFQFQFLTPSELVEHLGTLDLLLTFDLSPLELPSELVSEFVRSGGGWFACGGWGSLPGWGSSSSESSADSLASLLPLIPEPEGRSPRDVIFLVDGSGSMAGPAFRGVQQALARLVLSVAPEDGLWIRFFTGSLMEALDLRAGSQGPSEALQDLFSLRVPGGPTAILYSLDQLVAERADADRPSLIFLLSDGRDDVSHDVAVRAEAIAEGLSQGESRWLVVAAGDDPDRAVLEALLSPGEVLLEAGNMGELDELFQREVFRGRVREGELELTPSSGGQLEPTTELLESWNDSPGAWPLHRRYLRCTARPDADVLLRSVEEGEPLLAWRREGTGSVAAWASCTLPEWAPAMSLADALFAPLWRLQAERKEGLPELRMEVEDGELVLSGVPQDWPARVQAELHAQVWGQTPAEPLADELLGEAVLWPRAQVPGGDPRGHRQGRLPVGLERGVPGVPLHVLLRGGGAGKILGQVGLNLPCPAELEPGGGKLLEIPTRGDQSPAAGPRSARVPDPHAWAWIVGGLCALVSAALTGALSSGASGPRGSNSTLEHQGRPE